MPAAVLQRTAAKVISLSIETDKSARSPGQLHRNCAHHFFGAHLLVCVQCVMIFVNLRYVSALTTPARLSPVEFHYPPLPPQVPTFQITSPNTSHALSLPPAAAYRRDDDQPLLRCPEVRRKP